MKPIRGLRILKVYPSRENDPRWRVIFDLEYIQYRAVYHSDNTEIRPALVAYLQQWLDESCIITITAEELPEFERQLKLRYEYTIWEDKVHRLEARNFGSIMDAEMYADFCDKRQSLELERIYHLKDAEYED